MNRWGWGVGLLALTLIVSACGSSTGPETREQIEGDWNWVESTGGIAGVTQTPASTGQTMRLHFLESDVVELYRDDALQGSTGYSIVAATDSVSATVRYDTPLFGFESQTVTFESYDIMLLVDPCCDGFSYRFERFSNPGE